MKLLNSVVYCAHCGYPVMHDARNTVITDGFIGISAFCESCEGITRVNVSFTGDGGLRVCSEPISGMYGEGLDD